MFVCGFNGVFNGATDLRNSTIFPFQILFAVLAIERLDDGLGAAALAVYSLKVVNEQLQKFIHILIIWNHKVNFTMGQLKSNALPAVKRKFV